MYLLVWCRRLLNDRHRGRSVTSMKIQRREQIWEILYRHIKNQRVSRFDQRPPFYLRQFAVGVARDELYSLCIASCRQRKACIRRSTRGRGDSGYDAEWNIVFL